MSQVVFLQPPSPPGLSIHRDYAGGYGTGVKSSRRRFGHEGKSHYVPALLNAATIASERYDVSLLDAQAHDLDIEDVLRVIAEMNPLYVVSVINLPSLEGDSAILRAIRERCGVRSVIGFGTVVRREWAGLLEGGSVDVLMCGDPEVQIMSVLDYLEQGSELMELPGVAMRVEDEAKRTQGEPMLSTLDELPIPDYGLLDLNRYEYFELLDRTGPALVYTSRGCPFACGYYCPYPYGFGRKIRFRSPELVGQELELLNKEHEVTGVLFRDQVFTIKRDHTEAICNQILNRELDIQWVCETKYDRVDRDLLELMKRAGCRSIHYGLESGDEKLFWTVGKPGGKGSPEEAMEHFSRSIAETKAVGIRAHVHTIVGLPGETKETIENTAARLKSLDVDSVSAGIITPYPGTQLYNEAVESGWIREDSFSRFTTGEPVLEYEGFGHRDMLKARERLMSSVRRQKPTWNGAIRRIRRLGGRLLRNLNQRSDVTPGPSTKL